MGLADYSQNSTVNSVTSQLSDFWMQLSIFRNTFSVWHVECSTSAFSQSL